MNAETTQLSMNQALNLVCLGKNINTVGHSASGMCWNLHSAKAWTWGGRGWRRWSVPKSFGIAVLLESSTGLKNVSMSDQKCVMRYIHVQQMHN